jgi:hypothetical protein
MSKTVMKTKFVVLLSASVLIAAPIQAQASPLTAKEMLPFCKNELAKGQFGRCTGYIVAIYDEMISRNIRTLIQIGKGQEAEELRARGACLVLEMDPNWMRQVVISWIEKYEKKPYLRNTPNPSMYELTLDALRNEWGCSTPAPLGFLP